MKKEDVIEVLKDIKGAYGNKFEINEYTAEAWHRYLEDERSEHVFNRLDEHIRKETFPPSLKDLVSPKKPKPNYAMYAYLGNEEPLK